MLLLLLLFCFSVKAQNDKETQSLTDVLVVLEKRYDYGFNYAGDTVKNITLPPPPETLSFEEAIAWLTQQTGLTFDVLENNIVAVSVNSFSVCGYLKDEETGEPLAGAYIKAGKDESKVVGSDENGYFELAVNHENGEIVVSYLGYKKLSLPFSSFEKEDCNDIYLEVDCLEEVVVVGENPIKGIDKTDGYYELDLSGIDILPGLTESDVLYLIQVLPGIGSVNETLSNINIRGGFHDQTLMIWNGIKMYQTAHFGIISIFNPQMTGKAVLWKNGTDAGYSGGVSGTVLMKGNTRINNDFKGSIGIDFTRVNVHLDFPAGEKSSVQLGIVKSYGDVFKTPTYEKYFSKIARASTVRDADKTFGFYNVAFRWLYNMSERDKIRMSFINAEDKLKYNNYTALERPGGSLLQNSIAGGVEYERTWNAVQTNIHIYGTVYKHIEDRAAAARVQENTISEFGLKANVRYRIREDTSWDIGYELIKTGVNNRFHADSAFFNSREAVRTHSLYSQTDKISEDRRTRFKLGFRLNYIEPFRELLPEPRLSLSHRLSDVFTVEIQGEFKHQYIFRGIAGKYDFSAVENFRWYLSDNDAFPLIKSRQFSLGFNYNEYKWLVSVAGYCKYVTGMTIMSQKIKAGPVASYIADYRVSGAELLIRRKVKNFNLWISYSYMSYKFDDQPDKADTPSEAAFPSFFDIPHAINFGTTYTAGNFSAAAGLNWHSGLPKEKAVFTIDPLAFPDNNNGPLPRNLFNNYFRVDASARYRFKKDEKPMADLSVSLWNLWSLIDRNNFVSNYYNIRDTETEKVLQPGLEATLNMTLRVYL